MLVAVAFVPSPPLLLTALGGGPDDLGAACRQALFALDGVERVVVVGAAPSTGWMTGSVDATPYGAPGPPALDPLPLSLAVGTTLLGDRLHELYGVGTPADVPTLDGARRTGLLVVGDGSARRSEKAPGHLDPRAGAFDGRVEQALAAGDPKALLDLDPFLAAALLVEGRRAWEWAAQAAFAEVTPKGAAPLGWHGNVLYNQAPYGVCYLVATWLPRGC